MPDRIIRDELLQSEKWLSLKDNADRLAFVALLLSADSLGNFSAEPFRLLRLWRDYGISTAELVAKTTRELVDHDLIRLYQAKGKPLLHVPNYRQRLRYIKRVFPPSPWTTDEQKQILDKISPDWRLETDGLQTGLHPRSEEKRREKKLSHLDLNEQLSTGQKSKPLEKMLEVKNTPPDPSTTYEHQERTERNRKAIQDLLQGSITQGQYRQIVDVGQRST